MPIDVNESIPTPATKRDLILDIVRRTQLDEDPKKLWDQAIILAKEEEKVKQVIGSYPDITVDEITAMGNRVKELDSAEEKYKLLMEKTTSGKLWYDVLMGDANKIMFAPIESAVRKKFDDSHTKWGNAADIGTGTGNTIRCIAPYCEKVHGVDLARFSLRSAMELGLPDNVLLVQGQANQLPFKSHSLDLVVSNGLIYYLSLEEAAGLVQELARILKRGGKFYKSDIVRENGEIVPRVLAENLGSAKNALIDLVERLANGGGNPDSPSMVDFNKLMLQNRFILSKFIKDEDNRVLAEYTRIKI
jgi:ubiquinone/menaquinone biosynthesis C-methylase UbiE